MTASGSELIYSTVTRDEWQLETDKIAVHYSLLNDNIIYGKSTGDLAEHDLVASTDMLHRIVESVAEEITPYYLLFETDRSTLSRKSREFYIEAIKTIYYAWPFEMYMLLHPNQFFRTVLNFTRFLLPFPATAVVSMEEALRIASEQKTRPTSPPANRHLFGEGDGTLGLRGEHHRILDGLSGFLSGVEQEAKSQSGDMTAGLSMQSLAPVFDVIELVRADIDNLFQEHISAQAALARSEDRYRTIIENIEDGYYESDLVGRLTVVNESLCRMYGYPREELLGVHYRKIMDEINATNTLKTFNALYASGQPVRKVEQEIIRKDNTSCAVEVSASLIKDDHGEVTGFRGIVRDVTESRRVKEQLRRSEEKYRLLFDHADAAIFVVQGDKILFPNRQGQSFLGISEDEIDLAEFANMVHPDDRDMVADRYVKRIQGEKVASQYSFRVRTTIGKIAWVQVNPVRIEWDGKPATVVFLRDVTLQKNMETQLRQTHKMEAIGTLAGGIAHDFNNILAAIMGYTEVVLGETPKDTVAERNLAQIRIAVLRARDIIRQILTFSRPASDERPYPVRASVIVREVLNMLERTLPVGIEIVQSFSAGKDRVLITTAQLYEVVMNLCTNAINAMHDTGGVLSISLEPVKLNPDFVSQYAEAEPGHYLRLMIQDTGHGISSDKKEHIFEPYFTTRPHGEGTGMGLAVVHALVASNGGIITVDSKEDEGSTFCVFFPIIEETVADDRYFDEDISLFPEGNEHILFVDDKRQLCEIGKNLLERFGYDVVTAHSAAQALAILDREPGRFDLVVTDLVMPGMNGDQLAREIYRRSPEVPVVLCTGHDEQGQAIDIRGSAIVEQVSKPYVAVDFAVSVRRALDERKANSA